LLASGAAKLEIVGDGPQMPEIKALIERYKLGDVVQLTGWVKHAQMQGRLVENDLFVFPSIREFGGAVALEAMAVGVVPVVMNYGGLGELVTPKTGFLLNMDTREGIINQLRTLLQKVVENPSLIDERTGPALERAHEKFTWEAKARQVLEVYDWVLGRRTKPEFPMPIPD
jgi:starch synthase